MQRASGTADAATVSQVFNFDAASFDGTPAVQTAFVEAFDPALGELENIVLSVDIETKSSGLAINRTDDVSIATFTEQFAITLDGPVFNDLSVLALAIDPFGARDAEFEDRVEFEDVFQAGSGLFDTFGSGGALDLSLALRSNTEILSPFSAFSGVVQVDFNFAEVDGIAPVPLPASVLFLFAGLGALVMPRLGRVMRGGAARCP